MAASFGDFDADKEDWLSYTERLQQYFLANKSNEDKQKAVLLSVCGPSIYQLIKDIVAPQKPSNKSFKELVTLVDTHKNPKPSVQ